jgi:methylamine dehydrogenase accessory protein MauD
MDRSTLGLISYAVLWVVVVVQAVLTIALARMVGRLTRKAPIAGARVIDPGPEIGEVIESWTGVDLTGKAMSLTFPRERGVFLLYVSPHCTVCTALLPSAKRFFKEIAAEAEGIWVLVLGQPDTQVRYAQQNGLMQHAVVAESQLPPSWRLGGAPFGVWIDAVGTVKAKGMADRREHLESLRNAAEVGHPSVQSYLSAVAEHQEQDRERLVELR